MVNYYKNFSFQKFCVVFFIGPIQAEVLPKFAQCMGKQPKNNQNG